MRLTTKSEYALLALTFLARHEGEVPIPLAEVALKRDIPLKYLEHIAVVLCHAGILASARGPHGGYRLARPASEVTLAEVIRLMDGALAPNRSSSRYFYEPSPLEREKKLMMLMREIRTVIAERLEGTTLADVT